MSHLTDSPLLTDPSSIDSQEIASPARRKFIKQATLAGVGLSQLGLSSASHAGSHTLPSLAMLDSDIIDQVKRLRGSKNINLKLLYPEGSLANLQPIISRFVKETGVSIELKEVGVDDINSTIIFKAAENKYAFDIALPATFGVPDLVTGNALQPLDVFKQRYEPIDYQKYQLYDYGDYVDGQFYGYQTDGDTYLMFYNKAFLDDADHQQAFRQQYGYDLMIPKTWEQLDDMITFFHQPEKQQYGGCLFRTAGYGAWEWWSRFHANGFFPLNDEAEPQINNAAGVKALQDMIDISTSLHPKAQTDGLFENWDTFAQGQTFCNIGWGGSQKAFNRADSLIKDQLYYAPAPGGTIGSTIASETVSCPIFNWGWNYVVSSLSANPEIAYLFTLFATSPVMSTLAVQQDGYFDPFRQEHYADPKIQSIYSNDFLSAHQESMQNSIPDFYILGQSAYLSVLQENIHLASSGQLSAQQALDLTATEWRILTSRIGKKEQQAIWKGLKEKYPPQLRRLLKG